MGAISLPIQAPVLTFAILMVIILIAPLTAQRLRGPGMVGLIIAGILIGPNAFNVLERSETIVLLGTAGLLYIMFIAGLEIDLHQFRKYRSHSLVFGSLTFFIPQILGTLMALWFLGYGWAAAILLASMFASHTLLPYPIVSRLGLGKRPAVTTAVGGTIITDTAALLVLAVVAASTRGELNAAFCLTLSASLAGYTALVWWGLPWISRWFFNTIPSEGVAHFVFIMAAVFLCAFFAEVAGVEAIIGAFLAGLVLNRLVPEQSVIMGRLEFAGSWFFIPVFLISVGMLVDPRILLSDFETWKVSIAMVVTVILTKFAAAWIAARLLNYKSIEGRIMFGLSVNQAAATLAAVMVGFQLGIFDKPVLNGAIMMILATCLIGPWMTQRYGRQLAQQNEDSPEELMIAKPRIMIPLRNPRGAEAILDVALMIRPAQNNEPIYPLTVVQDTDNASRHLVATERMLGYAVMHAASASVPVSPTIRLDTNTADGIIRATRELHITTVVMGWTGAGAARNRIFGTVLDQLLKRCPQQFIVCRFETHLNTVERMVLVVPPFAGREPGFVQAVHGLKLLAQRTGSRIAISAAGADMESIAARIASIPPDVPIERFPVESIDDWLNPSLQPLRKNDLMVLISARHQQPSWQSTLDRIPQSVASMHSPPSMLVVYPSEVGEGAPKVIDQQEESHVNLAALITPHRIQVRSPIREPHQILTDLLASQFPDQPQLVSQLHASLLSAAAHSPIGIGPGTVLLHTYTEHIDQPIAFVATLLSGARFGGTKQEAKTLFVLLTPPSLSAATHLQNLAAIAKLLSRPRNVKLIQQAATAQELHQLLAQEA